jgi:hypothetical protein
MGASLDSLWRSWLLKVFVEHKSDSLYICAFAGIFEQAGGTMGSNSSDDEEEEFNGDKEDELERGHGRASRARGHEDTGYYSKSPVQSDMDDEEVQGDYQRRTTTSRGGSQMKRKAPPANVTRRRVLNNARLARQSEQERKSRGAGKSATDSTRRQGGRGTGAPGLSVAMEATEVRMRAVVGEGTNMHYGEDGAVKNFVRQCIYPKKKTFFSEQEYMFGSALAKRVIHFILYDRRGHYKMEFLVDKVAKASMEIAFWARVVDSVRRVLKEKLNNSLSRFREKFVSKLESMLSCEIEPVAI